MTGHTATVTPEGAGYLVACPFGCKLGTSAHAPDEVAASRRVELHRISTATSTPVIPDGNEHAGRARLLTRQIRAMEEEIATVSAERDQIVRKLLGAGWTQREVAASIGISQPRVKNIAGRHLCRSSGVPNAAASSPPGTTATAAGNQEPSGRNQNRREVTTMANDPAKDPAQDPKPELDPARQRELAEADQRKKTSGATMARKEAKDSKRGGKK